MVNNEPAGCLII